MQPPTNSQANNAKPHRDWTKGSITRNLFSITWPIMINQGLNLIGPFIDMLWIGRLGASSVAGVGIAAATVILMNSAAAGLSKGQRALIARYIGANDYETANHANRQAFVVGIGFSIIVAIIGIFLAEQILGLFGVEADVIQEGAAYIRIQFIGMITMSFRIFTQNAMQASGDVMTPMKMGLLTRGLHVALCPAFVFGWWIFPQLGVSGAALATVIAQGIGAGLGFWILLKGQTRLKLTFDHWRFDFSMIWRLLKIGIPSIVMDVQHHFSSLVLMGIMASFGTLAVASHALWQRLDSVLTTLSMGIGLAAGVMGAQNLGADQLNRAKQSGWLSAGFSAIFNITCSVILFIWAETFAGIFTSDPELITMTSTFLRISSISYFALGVNLVFMGFLTGVGDTVAAMVGELLQTWAVQIPLALLLPAISNLGVVGARWGIACGYIFAGVIFTLYFWWGRWRHRKV